MNESRIVQIFEEERILEVIKTLQNSKIKLCFVKSADERIVGTVTDGDVRRGILEGISVEQSVQRIMNKKFVFRSDNKPTENELENYRANSLFAVPVLSNAKKLTDVIMLSESVSTSKKLPNKVFLLAGGLGSRLGELTKEIPKPMSKVGSKPILQIIIENFKTYGFHDFIISLNYKSDIIEDYFRDGSEFGVSIEYVREKDRQGTAGSLSLIEEKLEHPIIVMNGDLLTNIDFSCFLDYYQSNEIDALMCVREYDFQVPFGVVQTDGKLITSIDEKPVQKFLVNAGVYLLSPECINQVPKEVVIDMPTLFDNLLKEKLNVSAFPLSEYWLDIGRIDDLEKAQVVVKDIFKK